MCSPSAKRIWPLWPTTCTARRPAADRQHPHLPGYCRAAGALPEGGVRGAAPSGAGQKAGRGQSPLYQCMGGTSAETAAAAGKAQGRRHEPFQSLSAAARQPVRFSPGGRQRPRRADAKGLIVPRFGKKPENHVALSMTMESFCELLLLTRAHYQAWLSAGYARGDVSPQEGEIPSVGEEAEKTLF